MPIPDPWESPDSATANPSEEGPDRGREREPERDRARAREEPAEQDAETEGGEVLPFPSDRQGSNTTSSRVEPHSYGGRPAHVSVVKLRKAAAAWTSEAGSSARAALDGSVWRARPPSLRDIHTRARRAEWSGDIPALRAAGQWFGWVSLVITAVGYALLWLARRPSRLLLTTAVAVLITVLAV
ncbi:hypothetical protein SAMN04487905_12127 [Actinopolyspora xinjiangensis]|uniref:Uncharacterized protein n=1 Tax=Actinopolyspora xinjiangensis TaxID=405564 RepID=A0A1H0X2M0_9ACTN|nr:hypothetical protein [Actinopolyspora xinjiangensis]SDP96716.1 hypothetical protein SAMN04487905_12127 [Actinopolyspora xinjiangensis]